MDADAVRAMVGVAVDTVVAVAELDELRRAGPRQRGLLRGQLQSVLVSRTPRSPQRQEAHRIKRLSLRET